MSDRLSFKHTSCSKAEVMYLSYSGLHSHIHRIHIGTCLGFIVAQYNKKSFLRFIVASSCVPLCFDSDFFLKDFFESLVKLTVFIISLL